MAKGLCTLQTIHNGCGSFFAATNAADVHLLGLAQFLAVGTLSRGATLLLDFMQGSLTMIAGGRAVALDTGCTCKLLAVEEDHDEGQVDRRALRVKGQLVMRLAFFCFFFCWTGTSEIVFAGRWAELNPENRDGT